MLLSRMLAVLISTTYARVAQLVERDLAKVEAAGSSPVSRSNEHERGYPNGYPFFVLPELSRVLESSRSPLRSGRC